MQIERGPHGPVFVAPPQKVQTRWQKLPWWQKTGIVIGAVLLGAGALRFAGWMVGAGEKRAASPTATSTGQATRAPSPSSSVTEASCAAMGPNYELVLRIDPITGAATDECREKLAEALPPHDRHPGKAVAKKTWEAERGPNTWPARPESGRLECVGPSMVFFVTSDGAHYAVNGSAMGCLDEATGLPHARAPMEFCRGARDFRTIWLDDPHPPKGGEGFKISIGDFIPIGLGLCPR